LEGLVEVWDGLEGLWEVRKAPVKRSGKVWRVCEEVGERGGGSLRMSGKGCRAWGRLGY